MSAPDATKPVGAGSVLVGRYRLVRLVAQGGMASVWEGQDNVLARSVAVKILHPHLAADRLFLERFRREAVSAARLAHPNVVATYDAGISPEGTAFIVMELSRGETLSAFATQHRPLPIFVCVEVGMQIADALAHAHGAGLVHRDIKPANVLVCDGESDGVPHIKVTDFGIAKAAEGLGLELTKTGMILGTPKYLSPEQIDGREPDARADLYALGVVLFEMVAGLAPFRGPTEMALAVQHLNELPPRLRDLRPATPAALDLLVAALLSKRPEDRPPSAAAVRQALARVDTKGRRPPPADPTPAAEPLRPTRPDGATEVGPSARPPAAAATPALAASAVAPPRTPLGRPRHAPPLPPRPGRTASGPPRRPPPPANWTGRLVAGLVVVALFVVLAVVVNRGSSKGHVPLGSTTITTTTPVAISHISVFHLERDADDTANVGFAVDGNPNTAWQTDHYDYGHFAGLRNGLGLALTLGSSGALHTLTVLSATPGWSAQIYVADAVPSPPALGPWGLVVDSKEDVTGTLTTFDLHGHSGSAILFWLTDLGPNFQTSVAEITVR